MLREKQQLLRIFIGEDERWGKQPLYEALLEKLCERGCRGATVVKAVSGFGPHRQIHRDDLLRLSAHRPLIVEVVDSAEIIDQVIDLIQPMIPAGMATLADVDTLIFGK
ncbi:MAG: DUF190 domain-containing protein [Desulfuromonadaceae bacterium]|nr:DUF190 domain-containing protein [Desulfuromonadaceae bacterium]